MKRIGAFSFAIFIFVLSVFSVVPVYVRADDDKTVIPLVEGHFGLTESDAQSKVAAHKDIYYDNDQRAFAYTPASSYNWTLCNDKGAVTSTHLSDKQVVALLCSSNKFVNNRTLFTSFLSNNNIFRGFMSGVGALFTGDSDNGTKFLDTLTGNYNYLDSLNYDEDSKTITMSNDNGSVDKLREEIKQYYYDSIGLRRSKSNDTTKNPGAVISFLHTFYEYEEDYTSDFMACNQYDYATCSYMSSQYSVYFAVAFDKSSYSYAYIDNSSNLYFTDKDLSILDDDSVVHVFLNHYKNSSTGTEYDLTFSKMSVVKGLSAKFLYSSGSTVSSGYISNNNRFYSQKGIDFVYFSSFEKLYNFVHGSQSAYLSSRIDKAGEDISYSIKDMNENLGTKMDELIDSINSGKGNMSADELQNAIDKGLEDLNKNTEDIKDNTSDILEVLKEQNNILLQILGVTEYIAYQTTKDDGSSYTKTDLTNTINKIYNGLGNAILYGKNTLTSSGDSSGAASQSYIVTREDFKLSNNLYTSSGSGVSPGTPVVAYSLDDYSVYDVSNDYDVGISTQDINNMDIHDGLFGKFPFSVPYQLYEWLQVLQADPVAPKLVYNYGFLLGHKDDQKYDLVIDFNIYEPWANVCKSFLRLSFTLAMSLFLYKKFKGNSIF